jgi:hypothetical protein
MCERFWTLPKNHFSDQFIRDQTVELFEGNRDLYETVNEVPKRLLRTPLQRAIQLMKRHRDVFFSNRNYKPISIIITTIATHLYDGENLIETIGKFVDYVTQRHKKLILDGELIPDGILDYANGEWKIVNPADASQSLEEQENFADKWNLDRNFAWAFFAWVRALKLQIYRFENSAQSSDLKLRIPDVNNNDKYVTSLLRDTKANAESGTFHIYSLLWLIHLAIEGEVDWSEIDKLAKMFVDTEDLDSKDVAKINYYQTLRHRGIQLPIGAKNDLKEIIQRHSDDPTFVLCGNLLLDSATFPMLRECIRNRNSEDVFDWPILRLASPRMLFPG